MSEREERRYAEIPRDSVRLMGESVGLELPEPVAAMLAEDVCYRLRQLTQGSAQFMKHSRRRRLSTEDFNRALRWTNVEPVCGHGGPDGQPLRSVRDGELLVPEEREVNLLELALATNIPKGCPHTLVRVQISYLDSNGNEEPQGVVPSAVSSLSDDLMKYYQQVTRAVLGHDHQLMKIALQDLQSNSKIAALLPYFVYVVSGVKSVSHDLEQLSRLLYMVQSLVGNPYLYLGSYARSLLASVTYCILEPLAASINPLNDHWTLRDYAALLLNTIFRREGELVRSLYPQTLLTLQKVLLDPVRPLCSHYGALVGLHALGPQAVERVLCPQLASYWPVLQGVLEDTSVSNAQVKADGHKVYGAILVSVEKLLKTRARQGLEGECVSGGESPWDSPAREAQGESGLGLPAHLLQGLGGGGGVDSLSPPRPSLLSLYRHLYSFFGDALSLRLGPGGGAGVSSPLPRHPPPPPAPPGPGPPLLPPSPGARDRGGGRKMPQLTLSMAASPPGDSPPLQRPAPSSAPPPLPPPPLPQPRAGPDQAPLHGRRPLAAREVFAPFPPSRPLATPTGHPSFLIGGRQAARRVRGRVFQTSFTPYPTTPLSSRYAHRLPMIGRLSRSTRLWPTTEYSLLLPL